MAHQLVDRNDSPKPHHAKGLILDLSEVAQSALDDISARTGSRSWESAVEPGVLVVGDAQALYRVVSNLLENARVHTPPGSRVRLAVTGPVNDRVLLSVADDGPGLGESELRLVFDRFWRADTSRSRHSGGSGLGLSIVAAVVDAHRGSVDVTRSDSSGACFVVALPAAGEFDVVD